MKGARRFDLVEPVACPVPCRSVRTMTIVQANSVRSVLPLVVLVALPALVLAGIGTLHPLHLIAADALRWRNIHVAALFVFPFLGVPPWLLLRRRSRPLAAIAAILGYVYAAGYTALDVLAGIGAGNLKVDGRGGQSSLYHPGDALGRVGTVALLLAVLIAVGVTALDRPALTVPGSVLVLLAAVSFLTSHIVPPVGVITMVLFALGWSLLVLGTALRHDRPAAAR